MLKVYYGDSGEGSDHEFSWNMLRKVLKEDFDINFSDDDIIFNEHGKPFLKGNLVYFNISHYGNLCAVAISDNEVGIDTEHRDMMKDGFNEKEYRTWLSDKEQKELLKSDDPVGFLAIKWAEKRSILKMIGSGLLNVQSLKNAFRRKRRYNVTSFWIGNYCLSVTNRKGEELKMRNLVRFKG